MGITKVSDTLHVGDEVDEDGNFLIIQTDDKKEQYYVVIHAGEVAGLIEALNKVHF